MRIFCISFLLLLVLGGCTHTYEQDDILEYTEYQLEDPSVVQIIPDEFEGVIPNTTLEGDVTVGTTD